MILVCVVSEEGEDRTKKDKSGSEGSKNDSGDEGEVKDIVDETGMAPAKAQKLSLTGLLSKHNVC